MKKLLSLLVILLFALSAYPQKSKEEKVWARVDAFQNAVFGTKDSTVIAGMVGEKLTYGHSGGNIENKVEMVHNAAVSPTTYKNLTTERNSLDIINKNTAIARFNYRGISIDNKGQETPLNLHIIQVWAREGGDWKLQARQAVKINPK